MDIPVIYRITDFDAKSLSYFSQTLSVSDISKWTPLLVLALAAAFAGLVNTVKLFAVKVRPVKSLGRSQQPILDCDSDADTACSSDEEEAEVDDCRRRWEDDFRVRGSGYCIDERWQPPSIGDFFSWSDLAAGKSVVKLWDNLGLGFDLLDENFDFATGKSSIAHGGLFSPPVVVSAGRNIGIKVWDRRVSCRVPAIIAEWRAGDVAVGDIRKTNAPVENLTGWDADAVTDGRCF